jgi:hypothetical protein
MSFSVRNAKHSTSSAMRSCPSLIVAASIVSAAGDEWFNGTLLWNRAIGSSKDPTQSFHGNAGAASSGGRQGYQEITRFKLAITNLKLMRLR